MSEFSERLKQCRQAKGLRQQDVAEQLGIIYRTYRRYESGETEPTISIALQLADFFQVSLDELAGRTVGDSREPKA